MELFIHRLSLLCPPIVERWCQVWEQGVGENLLGQYPFKIPTFPSLQSDVQMDLAKRPATQRKEPQGPMLPARLSLYRVQAYLVLLRLIGVAFFFKKAKARPSSSKDYDHFIRVVWKRTRNTSGVHLYPCPNPLSTPRSPS